MTADEVLARLRDLAAPEVIDSMGRFAIPTHKALGVTTPALRRLAKEIGKTHMLAQALWRTGVFEARLLAPMIDEPSRVTDAQMERWVRAFDSWALCDDCCFELFDKTPVAWRKAMEWSTRTADFEKRAGFSLMAALARHHRNAADIKFSPFLAAIQRESGDGRNFVKKAVNWALREIGKRNLYLNRAAVREAMKIRALGTPSGRWIAADALRELTSSAVQARLRAKQQKARSRAPAHGKSPLAPSGASVPFRDEAQFVEWLRGRWPERAPGVRLGIGDDAAIVKPTSGYDLVLTTDLSLEDVHFRLNLHPPRSVGHRALARALSDLAAMGACPRFALVSLALPKSIRRSWIAAFYDGLGTLARSLGVTLIGGDTAATRSDAVMADVVAVGEVRSNQALGRKGAQPGDRIYVTGRLGMSALGLALLNAGARPNRGVTPGSKLRARDSRAALDAHLYPAPRCSAGVALCRRRLASAAIDISDGFARDLGRLCDSSGCGAVIWEDGLPLVELDTDRDRRSGALELGLYGGEDYELLFTVRPSRAAHVPRTIGGVTLHHVGEIRSGRGLSLIGRAGVAAPLDARGYDHFSKSNTE